MSIIQEALKKIDPPPARQTPPVIRPAAPNPASPAAGYREKRPVLPRQTARVPSASGKRALMPAAAVACAVCVAALTAVGAHMVTAKKVPAPAAAPQDAAAVPLPPPHQETIYKTVEAEPVPGAPVAGTATVVRSAPPDLRLDGIMYLDSGPRAIINNAIVGEGDMVSGATVTTINKKSVILTYNNVEITLNLK